MSLCGAIKLRVFSSLIQEGYIKYISCFTGPRQFIVFLGSSERYELYLWGSIFSLLIGFALVEQFNCEFWCLVQEGCIKYINCFTNSGSILVFLGSSESFKIYLLGSVFSLLCCGAIQVQAFWSLVGYINDQIHQLLHRFWLTSGSFESCKIYLLRSIFIFLMGCILVEKIQIFLNLCSIKEMNVMTGNWTQVFPKRKCTKQNLPLDQNTC